MKRTALSGLLSLLICCPLPGHAQPGKQQARLDSLIAEAAKAAEDSNGVKLTSAIALAQSSVNPDEGLKWAEKSRLLARRIGWRKGEALALTQKGLSTQNKSSHVPALELYFEALAIYEALADQHGIAEVTGNIGSVYYWQRNYPKAVEYLQSALGMADRLGDKHIAQAALGFLAGAYRQQYQQQQRPQLLDTALRYQQQALKAAGESNDPRAVMLQTSNTGTVYVVAGEYGQALACYFKSLRMAEDLGDRQRRAIALGNIGGAYYYAASDSAAPHADSLVQATHAANYAQCIAYLRRAVVACREAQVFDYIAAVSGTLSEALAATGDFKGAYAVQQEARGINDTLHNKAITGKIEEMETQRAIALKDKDLQIARLAVAKERYERRGFLAGIALLLAILGILYRNNRRQRQSNALLSTEKQRSDDLLLNILPGEVAEELKASGGAQARQFDNVTVLFTDFVNFTTTAEQLSPQALVQELHECFTAFDAIIERHGLEKIKTIGDAYLAVCGLPNEDPRHAQKAVQAAIDIRDFVGTRLAAAARPGDHVRSAFQVRIGINSGQVIAGIVGVKKFAYDIWGDAVNLAARMEQHGEPGRINISQGTYALVRDDFACSYRGEIPAKNKGEVAMYFVEAPGADF